MIRMGVIVLFFLPTTAWTNGVLPMIGTKAIVQFNRILSTGGSEQRILYCTDHTPPYCLLVKGIMGRKVKEESIPWIKVQPLLATFFQKTIHLQESREGTGPHRFFWNISWGSAHCNGKSSHREKLNQMSPDRKKLLGALLALESSLSAEFYRTK